MNCESTVVEMVMKINGNMMIDYKAESAYYLVENFNASGIVFVNMNDCKMLHSQIPKTIVVNDRVYTVFAIVERIKYAKTSHYKADIMRSNGQWYQFDNKAKNISASKFESSKPKMVHLLSYKLMVSSEFAKKNLPAHPKDSKIIKNFHSTDFNGTIITVNNCFSPDAILHCLCNIYAANSSVFNGMNSNIILDILKAYAKGDISLVYEYRVKLLLQKGFKLTVIDNEVVLNAQSNIGSTFSMICADALPSGKISYTCDCGTKSTALSLLEVDSDRLNSVGVENLASCIMLNRQRTRSKCKTCSKATHTKINVIMKLLLR